MEGAGWLAMDLNPIQPSNAKELLSGNDQRFRAIFDSVHEPIFVQDPETGAILDANLRACEMWGYSHAEMLELDVGDLGVNTPPYTQHDAQLWITRATLEKSVQVFEWHARDTTGRLFWVEVNMRSLRLDANLYVVAAVRDISKRKEAEAKLQQAVAHWDASFGAINDQIYLLDRDGHILQCNAATSLSLNLPVEKIIGNKCHELFHGACACIPDCPMQRTLASGKRESIELQQGDQWFNITTDPVFDKKGDIVSTVHIVRDITERKRAAAEREELLQKLQAALSEIKTLNGLLPICANCKKIRDDKGYWIQIESYIETRLDAHFSHGICPDCAQSLYPEHYQPEDGD